MKKYLKNYLFSLTIFIIIMPIIISGIAFIIIDNTIDSHNIIQADKATDLSYYCLRDEFVIYTEDQNKMGLCWDFTCNKVIETMLAKKYNMFVDFSESWVALCDKLYNVENQENDDRYIGGGGSLDRYLKIINSYGIMLEEDFTQEYMYNLDSENYSDYYRIIRDDANTKYRNLIERKSLVAPSSISQLKAFTSADIVSIKEHLVNYSAVYARVDSSQIVNHEVTSYLDSTNSFNEDWHSVTIIGWDDDIIITDKQSQTHKGAFIVLNSWGEVWGNDGIFYIPYDVNIVGDCSGFKLKDNLNINEFLLNKSNSSSLYTILNKNKYSSSLEQTSAEILQYNVFQMKDSKTDVELDYTLSLRTDFNIDSIIISRSGIDYTDRFSIELSDTRLYIKSLDNNLEWGTYKILLSNGIVTETLTFYIISGGEIAEICTYYSDNYSVGRYSLVNNISSNETEIVEEFLKKENSAKLYCSIMVYLGTYSRITDIKGVVTITENVNDEELISYATESQYSDGCFYILLGNLENGRNVFNFTLQTYDNNELTYTIVLYRYFTVENYEDETLESENQKKESIIHRQSLVSIVYDTFNVYNPNPKAVSYNYLTEGNTLELMNANKTGYTFCGWYTDKNLLNKVTEITSDIVSVTKNATNYLFFNNNIIDCQSKTIFLYAKFVELDIQCDFETIIMKKLLKDHSDSYEIVQNTGVPLGNQVKIHTNNINYTILSENIIEKNLTYKIFWNDKQSEYYESCENGIFTQEDIITGTNYVKCEIKFYYEGYEVTSTAKFIKYCTYEITPIEIYGENRVGHNFNVPEFDFGNGYKVTYNWYVGSGNNFDLINNNHNDLYITEEYGEQVIYCTIIVKNSEDDIVMEEMSISRYVFMGVYSIILSNEPDNRSLPLVGYSLRVKSNVKPSDIVNVIYKWAYIENGEEIILNVANSDILAEIPGVCANKKIYCIVELNYGNDTNIQRTDMLTVLDIRYGGSNIYGDRIFIDGISEEYQYSYIWSNNKEAKEITISKQDMLNGKLSCRVCIEFAENQIVEITLPEILTEKRDIEIIIDDCESFYGEEDVLLTYHFAENKYVFDYDMDNFNIILKRAEGTEIGEYYIMIQNFDIIDSDMENYYNTEYIVHGSAGLYGIYTIKKLEFDFSQSYLVISGTTDIYTSDSFVYDGLKHGVSLKNLPDGIVVNGFLNDEGIQAGKYILKISEIDFENDFYSKHYNLPDIDILGWEWEINRKVIDFYYSWDYVSPFNFNGEERTVKVISDDKFPEGIVLVYTDNAHTNAGNYVAECYFNQDNLTDKNYLYNFIGDKLKWTIRKISVDFEFNWDYNPGKKFVYDGEEKSVYISTALPFGIMVEYIDNSNVAINAGKYIARAIFVYDNNNIELNKVIEDLEWEIEKYVYDLSYLEWDYTGPVEYSRRIVEVKLSSVPEEIKVIYTNNREIVPGSYTATVVFDYDTLNIEILYDPSILILDWEIMKLRNEITISSPDTYIFDNSVKNISATSTRNINERSELFFNYSYSSYSDSPKEPINKNNCRRVGYYSVVIEDPGDEFYERSVVVFDFVIYQQSLLSENKDILVSSEKGFGAEAYLQTGKISYSDYKKINSKFKTANSFVIFSLNILNDFESDKMIEIVIRKSEELESLNKKYIMLYCFSNEKFSEISLFKIDNSECSILCSASEEMKIIIIDGTNYMLISFITIIFEILCCIALYIFVYIMITRLVFKYYLNNTWKLNKINLNILNTDSYTAKEKDTETHLPLSEEDINDDKDTDNEESEIIATSDKISQSQLKDDK